LKVLSLEPRVAYEPELKAFPRFRIPYSQSGLDAHLFLKELTGRYGRKPISTEYQRFIQDLSGALT
jgi:hypothetical protein